jgi:hypothetical protein
MKLFIDIGGPEIFLVLLIPLIYIGLFILAAYILRWIFKVNKFDRYQTAQIRLLAEIAKKQGVDEEVLIDIESTLD